jgi:hypothetical protein
VLAASTQGPCAVWGEGCVWALRVSTGTARASHTCFHACECLYLWQISEASRCACAQITCSRTRPCTHLRAVVGWRRPSYWRTHPPTHKGRRSTTTHDTQTAQLLGDFFFSIESEKDFSHTNVGTPRYATEQPRCSEPSARCILLRTHH